MILFQRGATSWGFQIGKLYMYWPFLSFWRSGSRPVVRWDRS